MDVIIIVGALAVAVARRRRDVRFTDSLGGEGGGRILHTTMTQ